MSAIAKALASGYSAQKILEFISKKFPDIGGKIQKAQSFGYTIPQILNFLSENHELPSDAIRGLSESEVAGIQKQRDTARQTSGVLAAASAIPAISSLAAPASALAGQSPQLPIGPAPMANAPVVPPQIPPVPQGGMAQAAQAAPAAQAVPVQPTAQPPNIPSVASPTTPAPNSAEIIRQMGLEGKIKNLHQAGNNAEAISAGIQVGLSPGQKKWLEEKIKSGEAKPIEELVKDYLTAQPTNKQSLQVEKEKSVPFAGGRIVASPSGVVGKVESEKTKQALVNDDGKLKKLTKEEVFDVPENLQNLDYRDMARKYVESFPKEGQGSLSSNVASLLYDYESGEMYGTYVGSPDTLYAWKNVPAELYEKIKSQSTAPKTSGESFTGAWDASVADSLGSPLTEITRNPELYPFRKIPVGYNIMGKLLDAIKEEHKEHEKRKRKEKAHSRGP